MAWHKNPFMISVWAD